MKQNLVKMKDLDQKNCKILWNFIKVPAKICLTFVHFSRHGQKLTKLSKFSQSFLQNLALIFQTFTELNENFQNFSKFNEIS